MDALRTARARTGWARAFVALAALGLFLGMAGAGRAAYLGSGSVGPGKLSTAWTGSLFSVGNVLGPGACLPAICDTFDLTVNADSAYWESHDGGTRIGISWGDPGDDFDLYVYKGGLVASSASGGGTSESVWLNQPTGTYEIRVVPANVLNGNYSGAVTFSSEEEPAPTPTPPPVDGGEVGGGSGGGGDTGTGSGGSGSGGSGSGGSGSGGGSGTKGGKAGGPGTSSVASPTFGYPWPTPSYAMRRFDTRLVYTAFGGRAAGDTGLEPTGAVAGGGSTDQGGSEADGASGSSWLAGTPTADRGPVELPGAVWLLVPLGIVLVAAAALAVFEPVVAAANRGGAGRAPLPRRPSPSEAPPGFARAAWRAARRRR
ncbi:MAG: hypothetical protein HY658_15085 [Actinobacteria bacterium]|nr:hypothetical protein [Actinomycetota bacterium]